MNKKIELIKRYLVKRKEEEIFNLIVEDYENSNIYLGLIYNYRINQYKVLYVPLDLIDNDVDEYACYQFVRSSLVNFIMENLEDNVSVFQEDMFRFKYKYETYKITMKLFLERQYLFLCNRYIPIEWDFLYDILILLFGHSPNIISELCSDIVSLINNMDVVEYTMSYKFDLFKDKFIDIFSKKDIVDLNVDFLEKINNRYYSIVEDTIIIVEYNSRFKILNIYCDDYDNNINKIYSVLRDIKLEKFKFFYKIITKEDVHYLCYGNDGDYLKVIDGVSSKKIFCNNIYIEYDRDGYLERLLK